MRKETYMHNIEYIYDESRKNSKYSLDGGEHYMNHGEYCECLAKAVLGYEAKKDANTRHDKGHDIPELKASVKSQNCGLTDRKDMPHNKQDFMRKFWRTEKTETYIWVYEDGTIIDLWYMTRKEFQKFVRRFATWDEYCKKMRIKTCNNKINTWLETQLA